jgi:hypothetical protein
VNFNQWRNFAAKGAVPRVTYCCGDQSALVELVVEDIKNMLNVPDTDLIEIDACTQNVSVWDTASQYPLDPNSNRLVIIRSAEAVTSWNELPEWLKRIKNNTSNYILFVSYESDGPGLFAKNKKIGYQDHIEIIKNKGKFIRCSQPNDDDLVAWACSYGLAKQVAEHLMVRTSGDVGAMLDVLKKVHVWNGSPSIKAVDLLCQEQALDSFADYLILRDKQTAFLALADMSVEDKNKIISRLDYRLDTIMEIASCVRRRMYPTDIAATTGIKIFLVKKFIPVVKDYDERKIRYCRQLLAMVDSAINNKAKVGVWETLITLW